MDADLLRYVKRALRKGYDERRIIHQLRQQGWPRAKAEQAISEAKKDSGHGAAILAVLLILLVGVGIIGTWVLLGGSEDPVPNGNTSLNATQRDPSPVNDSNSSSNMTGSNTTESYVYSRCELRETQQAKFECYQTRLSENPGSVECYQLPQPDRLLCHHAYQDVVA